MHISRPMVAAALLLLAGGVGATPARPADERAALVSFEALLAGLGHRDKSAMLAHSLPGGHATLMRRGKPTQMTLEELAERVSVPGKDTHEETISDPLVRADDDVAIVWARFVFKVNGKVDHCGRDVATLVRVDGGWLVASIVDNATTDCGRG